ncbi:MAG: chaperone NapD [Gammaproteobacteria bacterium]|nr:chaperone NapD [Gammaproteobacteria bacterium]
MNIAGVVIHARPEKLEGVEAQLIELPGVEVHATAEDGRMVVTVEDEAPRLADTVMGLQDVEGVLSASLIYHHFEDSEQAQQ